MFIRDEWIKRTEFQDMKDAAVLSEVLRRVDLVKKEGKLPVVVFDLDSTLFDVSRRSYEILQEWITHPSTQQYSDTVKALKTLKPDDMKYSLQDVWDAKKINPETAPHSESFKDAKKFWRDRFFSNDYMVHDEPTDGAVKFVQELYERGAKIVYLTGRDVPLMSFGTFDQLKQHEFPIEQERSRLILKPKRHIDDLEFKSKAAATIMGFGEVVASFENEPKNLVAMASVFSPKTMNVFIHTVSSDHPAPKGQGIYRISHFVMERK